jgi:hypothetical protein
MTWVLDADNGETRTFDSRSEAEDTKADLETLGLTVELTYTEQSQTHPVSDGGEVVVSDGNDGEGTDLPDAPGVSEDPLTWMPTHFIDHIDGVPAINRKGYSVLAEQYDISVTAEPLSIPSESDWEYAEFRAVATTPDGREYSGFGSAHVDRGDDKTLLGEMAETRAVKRATANATGVGTVAIEEMQAATRGDSR